MTEPYEGEFRDAPILDAEATVARKKRNNWLGLALAGFVVLVGVVTIVRLSSSDLSKGAFYYAPDGRSGSVPAEADGTVALPPGMSEADAAPPPGIEATPAPKETPE